MMMMDIGGGGERSYGDARPVDRLSPAYSAGVLVAFTAPGPYILE
jgi:hypothetical protein